MLPITYGSILATFFEANDIEIIDGAQWYLNARKAAIIIADRHNVELETVVGVISALSPNNKWERNLVDANSLIHAYSIGGITAASQVKTSTYNANKCKALSILEGNEPLDILGGLKVRAFYNCIMGCKDAVCIDGHAYSIWKGERIPTTKTPSITPRVYAAIAADYQRAAVTINSILAAEYSAAEIQAVTWIVWRRLVK
jgi:hypothetical protein